MTHYSDEQIRKINTLMNTAGIMYGDACILLEQSDWDMLSALSKAQSQGIISDSKNISYSTKITFITNPSSSQSSSRNSAFKRIFKQFSKLLKYGLDYEFAIYKDGCAVFAIPVLVFIILMYFCLWLVLAVIAVLAAMRYSFFIQKS